MLTSFTLIYHRRHVCRWSDVPQSVRADVSSMLPLTPPTTLWQLDFMAMLGGSQGDEVWRPVPMPTSAPAPAPAPTPASEGVAQGMAFISGGPEVSDAPPSAPGSTADPFTPSPPVISFVQPAPHGTSLLLQQDPQAAGVLNAVLHWCVWR